MNRYWTGSKSASFVIVAVLIAAFGRPGVAATFTVHSVGDAGDSNIGDGTCDDGLGNCTLRAAIEEANASVGEDLIAFNIPGAGPHTIGPATQLPTITDPVVIDGYTQPGASPATNGANSSNNAVLMIELDGSAAGDLSAGLVVTGGNSTIRGVVVNRFRLTGIELSMEGGNVIAGNFIGTDVSGTVDFGNGSRGVSVLDGSSDNTIGGTSPASRNVIAGNTAAEVRIRGNLTTQNRVMGNFLGTDRSGTVGLGNGSAGIRIDEATNNTIGGASAAMRNIISGNSIGVIFGGATSGNRVQGNFIGTDVSGTVAVENLIAILFVDGASNNTIGGSLAGEGNTISGNTKGILIGILPTGNSIIGNFIGTQADGISPLGNRSHGVFLTKATGATTIGGEDVGWGNTIAFNAKSGVRIQSGRQIAIRGNSIHSNADLGIDLSIEGVTPNDDGDLDDGSNGLQNFPLLTSVMHGAGTTTITGTLDSTADIEMTIDFYSNSVCDPSGHGEGETFLGSLLLVLAGDGDESFEATLATVVSDSDFITATATDDLGNTSEFSPCFLATEVPTVSQWGLITLSLLILVAGTLVFARRPVAKGPTPQIIVSGRAARTEDAGLARMGKLRQWGTGAHTRRD